MHINLKAALMAATLLAGISATSQAAPLVTAPVDDAATLTLSGERSAYLARATDQGEMAASEALAHVALVLKRPPAAQAALDKLVEDQLVKGSPSYHKWLQPSDLRAYGPDPADIDAVRAWLTRHGLTVNSVSPSGMSIDFAGTPAAIAAAFHTSLHHVTLRGEAHIANMTDLAIPAALAPVLRGAVLSNFFPKPNFKPARPAPNYTTAAYDFYSVSPADFATIYNLNPVFSGANYFGTPITGKGITIAVVEQTRIRQTDWIAFRTQMGLSTYAGTLTLSHPHCADPGLTGDESEAALDAEWSSATAPDAAIIEASCAATSPLEFGVATALQGLVEHPSPATVLSISYGGAETANGLTFIAGWQNLVEEGAAEGKSIMISAGDSGAGGDEAIDTDGLAVNGLSTNPYNTTLGGTDFYDTAQHHNPTYWSGANSAPFKSVKSYVPEIPWDNSCASSIVWQYMGFANSIVACNTLINAKGVTTQGPNAPYLQEGIGGTGGQSLIYAKPSWQSAPGVPKDGVRDQPDVSLFASNGVWNHAYIYCMGDPKEGGTPCNFSKTVDLFGNGKTLFGNLAGGTSFAAPAFAGIVALLAQTSNLEFGTPLLGNPAPVLYQIASAQFSQPLLAKNCNATLGNKISTACVFNNVTTGNIAEPCYAGTANCYTTSASTNGYGVLSSDFTNEIDSFPAAPGYSLATGLGSVNVLNLLYSYFE